MSDILKAMFVVLVMLNGVLISIHGSIMCVDEVFDLIFRDKSATDYIVSGKTVPSRAECSVLCHQEEGCVSMAYSGSGECVLHGELPQTLTVVSNQDTDIYYRQGAVPFSTKIMAQTTTPTATLTLLTTTEDVSSTSTVNAATPLTASTATTPTTMTTASSVTPPTPMTTASTVTTTTTPATASTTTETMTTAITTATAATAPTSVSSTTTATASPTTTTTTATQSTTSATITSLSPSLSSTATTSTTSTTTTTTTTSPSTTTSTTTTTPTTTTSLTTTTTASTVSSTTTTTTTTTSPSTTTSTTTTTPTTTTSLTTTITASTVSSTTTTTTTTTTTPSTTTSTSTTTTTSITTTTEATSQEVELWVTAVLDYSSQDNSGDNNAASQVIGQPDVYPVYGHDVKAWGQSDINYYRHNQYVKLQYAMKLFISEVHVYETYRAGATFKVELLAPSGGYVVMYRATSLSRLSSVRIFKVILTNPASFTSDVIRIWVDPYFAYGATEIDAVKVVGMTDPSSR